MRIALCDDEDLETISSFIKEYKKCRPILDVRLSVFSSSSALLAHIKTQGSYDIYILDIIMAAPNGIETGVALREQNDTGIIIYLTQSSDFAVDSYKTQAFYYSIKPVSREHLFELLDKASLLVEKAEKAVITAKTPKAVRVFPIASILYAELAGRAVRYYLNNGEIINTVTFRGSFQIEISPLLGMDYFCMCGASFAVNLKYVSEITRTDLVLTNGCLVPISRKFCSKVKKQWVLYWLEGSKPYDS